MSRHKFADTLYINSPGWRGNYRHRATSIYSSEYIRTHEFSVGVKLAETHACVRAAPRASPNYDRSSLNWDSVSCGDASEWYDGRSWTDEFQWIPGETEARDVIRKFRVASFGSSERITPPNHAIISDYVPWIIGVKPNICGKDPYPRNLRRSVILCCPWIVIVS